MQTNTPSLTQDIRQRLCMAGLAATLGAALVLPAGAVPALGPASAAADEISGPDIAWTGIDAPGIGGGDGDAGSSGGTGSGGSGVDEIPVDSGSEGGSEGGSEAAGGTADGADAVDDTSAYGGSSSYTPATPAYIPENNGVLSGSWVAENTGATAGVGTYSTAGGNSGSVQATDGSSSLGAEAIPVLTAFDAATGVLSGTAPAGSTVRAILSDYTFVAEATVAADGSFTLQLPVGSDLNTIYVYSVDATGAESEGAYGGDLLALIYAAAAQAQASASTAAQTYAQDAKRATSSLASTLQNGLAGPAFSEAYEPAASEGLPLSTYLFAAAAGLGAVAVVTAAAMGVRKLVAGKDEAQPAGVAAGSGALPDAQAFAQAAASPGQVTPEGADGLDDIERMAFMLAAGTDDGGQSGTAPEPSVAPVAQTVPEALAAPAMDTGELYTPAEFLTESPVEPASSTHAEPSTASFMAVLNAPAPACQESGPRNSTGAGPENYTVQPLQAYAPRHAAPVAVSSSQPASSTQAGFPGCASTYAPDNTLVFDGVPPVFSTSSAAVDMQTHFGADVQDAYEDAEGVNPPDFTGLDLVTAENSWNLVTLGAQTQPAAVQRTAPTQPALSSLGRSTASFDLSASQQLSAGAAASYHAPVVGPANPSYALPYLEARAQAQAQFSVPGWEGSDIFSPSEDESWEQITAGNGATGFTPAGRMVRLIDLDEPGQKFHRKGFGIWVKRPEATKRNTGTAGVPQIQRGEALEDADFSSWELEQSRLVVPDIPDINPMSTISVQDNHPFMVGLTNVVNATGYVQGAAATTLQPDVANAMERAQDDMGVPFVADEGEKVWEDGIPDADLAGMFADPILTESFIGFLVQDEFEHRHDNWARRAAATGQIQIVGA